MNIFDPNIVVFMPSYFMNNLSPTFIFLKRTKSYVLIILLPIPTIREMTWHRDLTASEYTCKLLQKYYFRNSYCNVMYREKEWEQERDRDMERQREREMRLIQIGYELEKMTSTWLQIQRASRCHASLSPFLFLVML